MAPSRLSEQIRIAIIGTGTIGPSHAEQILANPDTVLCAMVDPGAHGPSVAAKFGASYYASVEELLQSPDSPDAAIICTPNHTHYPIAKQLAERGIDLLVEKPLSSDIESGQKLVDNAKAAGVKLLVGHHRRFNPHLRTVKENLATLGDVTVINGVWVTQKSPKYFEGVGEWRRSAGPVLINMIHEVDALQFLFGPITRVKGEKAVSHRGYEAEEGGAITLRFENGIVGSFTFCDNSPSPFNFESGVGDAGFPKIGMDFYRIFGSKATLSLPDMTRWSFDRSEEKSWWGILTQDKIAVNKEKPPLELQLTHFVNVIRGLEEPRCSGAEGLRALIVANAIKYALETGEAVDVEEFAKREHQ